MQVVIPLRCACLRLRGLSQCFWQLCMQSVLLRSVSAHIGKHFHVNKPDFNTASNSLIFKDVKNVCRNILVLFWLIDNFNCLWKPSTLQELSVNTPCPSVYIIWTVLYNVKVFLSPTSRSSAQHTVSITVKVQQLRLKHEDLWRDVASLCFADVDAQFKHTRSRPADI